MRYILISLILFLVACAGTDTSKFDFNSYYNDNGDVIAVKDNKGIWNCLASDGTYTIKVTKPRLCEERK